MIRLSVALAGALFVIGCSGSSASRTSDTGADDVPETVDVRVAENFDASRFVDSPAPPESIDHDVPEILMTGRAARDVRTLRQVQGYRIQIHSSAEQKSALQVEEEVAQWWRDLPVEERPADYRPVELPVEMNFVTPYYRVRVGGFESRAEAEAFLGFLGDRYPDAFLVLDTISVYR